MNGAVFLLFSLAAALLLPGCQTLQEIDRVAARVNEQLKARQMARRQHNDARPRRRCHIVGDTTTLSGVDIDTAYVRLKRYFNYKTLEEFTPYDRKWIRYMGFRHEAMPGVRYDMAWTVRWPSFPGTYVWLGLILERDNSGVLIRWRHCAGVDGWERLPVTADQRLARDIVRVARGAVR